MYVYYPKGVCSTKFTFDIRESRIVGINIENGCRGNLQGMSRLLLGMEVDEAIRRLEGISCRGSTSCPDQIARALIAYKQKQKEETA